MLRAVQLIHRYLGIAGNALLLLWCASGFVMMYVAYPSLSEARRQAGLQALDLSALRAGPALALPQTDEPCSVEMLDGQPVLRSFDPQSRVVSLGSGLPLTAVSRAQAARIARSFPVPGRTATPEFVDLVVRDQWTVAGRFNAERPYYLFALGDPQNTHVYVSSVTGRLVQACDTRQRFWNWLGPIPHWLYLLELRQSPKLWRQVVIVTALIGCFLTASGLYLGFQRLPWRKPRVGGRSQRLLHWHHVSGFFFGLFALTWVATGLLSVQPWGLLYSSSPALASLGTPVSATQLRRALGSFAPGRERAFVSLTIAPLGSELFLVASAANGQRERFNALGQPAPLAAAEVDELARRLGSREPVQRLDGEDAYLFSHHDERVALPAYRIQLPDAERSYLYMDAVTGLREAQIDRGARTQRWVDGMHRCDLLPLLRTRPLWDLLMGLALTGVSAVSVTGALLAYRRLFVARP